ncbi:hypothetical protein HYY70_00235 [Candidatus Woesearchaeota archaeon]|nr:hypothetical protein [Candidatus Woesearchaeota archaeon]
MTKINLRILDIEDVELKKSDKAPYIFTRIFTFVGYKKNVGYHTIKGIVKKQSCSLPVKIGFVETKLIDELKNETHVFTSLVYCADSNEVPVILGIKDALDKFNIEINVKQRYGYLTNSL